MLKVKTNMTCVINTFHNSTQQPGSAMSSQDAEVACSIFSLVTNRSYIIVLPRISCREGFISLTRNKWISRISTSTAQLCKMPIFLFQCINP